MRQRLIKHSTVQTERQAAERAALRAIKAEAHSTRLSVGVVHSIMVAADSALETERTEGFEAAVRVGLPGGEDEDTEDQAATMDGEGGEGESSTSASAHSALGSASKETDAARSASDPSANDAGGMLATAVPPTLPQARQAGSGSGSTGGPATTHADTNGGSDAAGSQGEQTPANGESNETERDAGDDGQDGKRDGEEEQDEDDHEDDDDEPSSKRRRTERRAAASAASTIASALTKRKNRPRRSTRAHKPRAATLHRRSIKVPEKLLPGLTPMAYRALYDLGEPMPAIGPISAAMAAASHHFNKQQDRMRRRYGLGRARDAGAAQGLLASSGLGTGSAPRAQVVRGIVRSFRSSEVVKKKDPPVGDKYQSDLPAYVGGRPGPRYAGSQGASSGRAGGSGPVSSSSSSSSSSGIDSQPVPSPGRLSFVPTTGTEADARVAAEELAPDLSEDPLAGVSDDEDEGDRRPRGGEMVWDPEAAARAGWMDPVSDECQRLEDFVEQYRPHARERAFRALHESGYDKERASARMTGRRAWLGERAENEWRTWTVPEAASFWVALEKHGKDFMAVYEDVRKAAVRQARDDARVLLGLPPRRPVSKDGRRLSGRAGSGWADEPDYLEVVEAKAQELVSARRERSLNACIGFFYAWWKAHPEHTHWKERRREEIFTNLEFHDEACGVCAAGGDLLCCDFCNKAYHLSCLGLAEDDVNMDAEWCCPTCCEVLDTPLARVRAKAFVRAESLRLQLVKKRHLQRKQMLQRKMVRLVAESVRCGGMLGYNLDDMVGPAAKQAASIVGPPSSVIFPSQAQAMGWAIQQAYEEIGQGAMMGWKGTGGDGEKLPEGAEGAEGDG